ncbi:MAG: c-type cytochrome [Candidatus Binatia bacterium]
MRRTLLGAGAVLLVLSGTVWAADGAAVYEKKCKTCHSVGGVGGPMAKTGGPLDGVGGKRDEAWLHDYLKDPKSKNPNAKMPKMSLSDDDLSAVVTYMLSLK